MRWDEPIIRSVLRSIEARLPVFEREHEYRSPAKLAAKQTDPVLARWIRETADPERIRRKIAMIGEKIERGEIRAAEIEARGLDAGLRYVTEMLTRPLILYGEARIANLESTREDLNQKDRKRVAAFVAAREQGLDKVAAYDKAARVCGTTRRTIQRAIDRWQGRAIEKL